MGESKATITGNTLSRTGGQPPIISVRDGAKAVIRDNRISGGGVAAILVQGTADIRDNTFTGAGKGQGNAVWIWENSAATIADNSFTGYRAALIATKATVVVTGNTISQFTGMAIQIKDSQKPAHVAGNTAISTDPKARVVEIQGPTGINTDNILKKE